MSRRGNGEGSIFKRQKNGKMVWVGQYALYKQPNGRTKYKIFYGKTREEVKNKLDKLITELNTDTYVDKSKIIFKTLTKQIIDDEYMLNKLNDNSYSRKIQTYNEICSHYIADMEIQKIQESDVKDFLAYITKYSNSVIGKIYGLANRTFKKAVKKNIIRYNLLEDKDDFPRPVSKRKDKRVRALTLEEQKQLINVLSSDNHIKYKYQILLSMYTGMRMGEINALTIKDIDFNQHTINVNKTLTRDKYEHTIMGKTTKTYAGNRILHVDKHVINIINEYLSTQFVINPKKLLFYDPKKVYITTGQVNMVFKRICKKYNISLGYNVNQHMLRHTFATRCIEAGVPANVVQKQMGHKDIKTTLETYTNVFDEYEKKNSQMATKYLQQNGLLEQNFGQ